MAQVKIKKEIDLKTIMSIYSQSSPYQRIGKVIANRGDLYEVAINKAIIGCSVEFVTEMGERANGEVVGIKDDRCLVMLYKDLNSINSQTMVYLRDLTTTINLSKDLLGRVVDYLGRPIDGKEPLAGPFVTKSIYGEKINPLQRPVIAEALDTGIKSINSFLTLGKGQRIAIMAGSGVGKSVLLGMFARNMKVQVNVIALLGERGREVLEFIQSELGEAGLQRSVVVVATSEESALVRVKAAYTALTIAEYYRDQGADVLLMMDSITRFAMASREIALVSGEPPGQKGYTPSVFAKLPKILERVGTKENCGTITGIFTVLVEGGEFDEPVTDAVRSIVDGHIVLSRDLAQRNHYPAVDILASISRVMDKVVKKEHKVIASYLRNLLAAYKEVEDLISVGAYAKGSNPNVDKAIAVYSELTAFLKQGIQEGTQLPDNIDAMIEIARLAEESVQVVEKMDSENRSRMSLDFVS